MKAPSAIAANTYNIKVTHKHGLICREFNPARKFADPDWKVHQNDQAQLTGCCITWVPQTKGQRWQCRTGGGMEGIKPAQNIVAYMHIYNMT